MTLDPAGMDLAIDFNRERQPIAVGISRVCDFPPNDHAADEQRDGRDNDAEGAHQRRASAHARPTTHIGMSDSSVAKSVGIVGVAPSQIRLWQRRLRPAQNRMLRALTGDANCGCKAG